MTKKNLFIYDFDGTLTNNDTFIGIIKHYKGFWGLLTTMLIHVHYILLMKLKLYSNDKTKEKIFSYVFRGLELSDFNCICQNYADTSFNTIIRNQAIKNINITNLEKENKSIIISASILNWIEPFAKKLNINTVLATEIEIDANGRITGSFLTKNCIGAEKVNRLKAQIEDLDNYTISAYGDSSGDKELLAFAKHAYYKPFRQ